MLRLSMDVWHGYTHPKGEIVAPTNSRSPLVRDSHGCACGRYVNSDGQKIELWDCEVESC